MSFKCREFLYRKLQETPLDLIVYEHRKINVRTYNIILKRNISNAKNNNNVSLNFINIFLI